VPTLQDIRYLPRIARESSSKTIFFAENSIKVSPRNSRRNRQSRIRHRPPGNREIGCCNSRVRSFHDFGNFVKRNAVPQKNSHQWHEQKPKCSE
jgi:hypothetical protein